MIIPPGVKKRVKEFTKPAIGIYPVIILIMIPALLIINTLWNLNSFNRDANFLVRHQAISIADTLKPVILEKESDTQYLKSLFSRVKSSNEDIVSVTILDHSGNDYVVHTSSEETIPAEIINLELNKLASAYNQPFAGLVHSSLLNKEIWNVVIPLSKVNNSEQVLNIQIQTKTVDAILARTSQDSLKILAVLIIFIIILLTNHFYFYIRSLEARKLEELDKLKDEFVSMAAHELRAPITALVGYLYMIRKKLKPEVLSTIESDLNILDKVTSELRDLINDLLDVSRIDQGRMKINPQTVQVNDVINNVITIMKPNAMEKNIAIKFIPVELPAISSDGDRIRQIITNLISNAIKYSQKGEIEITTRLDQQRITIMVKDTGIGIPAIEMQNLFSKFYRIKDKQSEGVVGTGLGLWITRQTVEALGGKIYAESIYGTGTSMIFTLPLGH